MNLDTETSPRVEAENENPPSAPQRELVLPGDELAPADKQRPGKGVYKEKEALWASQIGFRSDRQQFVNVVPFSGVYQPQVQDNLIATVISAGPSNWLMELNASHPATMHVTESPWRVDFGDTARFLNIGDSVYCTVFMVDETGHLQVSMKGQGYRKLYGGTLVEVSPYTVPRIIGRNGSMVSLLKEATGTRILVGQNGVVWVDGKLGNIIVLKKALKMVQEEAFTQGLTERIRNFLAKQMKELEE